MRARIAEKREVAEGTLLVLFDLLGREVDFRPGQYFWVTLRDPPYEDEKGPRRHISVVTSPNERGVPWQDCRPSATHPSPDCKSRPNQ